MQITHDQARSFIQFQVERALSPSRRAALEAHLVTCGECRLFAEEIQEVHDLLGPVMRKHWDQKPLPLSTSALLEEPAARFRASSVLVMRSAVLAVAFAIFAFSARQFLATSIPGPSFTPSSALPAPTPSAYTTSTGFVQEDCRLIVYTVQRGDTLDSLAEKFTVAKTSIMARNGLKSEALTPAAELQIAECGLTPTGTVIVTRYARTGTPATRPVSLTPEPGD